MEYEIELMRIIIRSLSPTINIVYGENIDFKTGQHRSIAPSLG